MSMGLCVVCYLRPEECWISWGWSYRWFVNCLSKFWTELGPLEEQEALNLQALKFGLWRDGAFKRTEIKEGNHGNIRD